MDNKEAPQKEGEILIDYYHATVATVGGDGYEELVLYSNTADTAKLVFYSKGPDDKEEKSVEYTVPYTAAKRCFEVIKEKNLRAWNEQKGVGMTGALTVVKFKDGEGYIRVSTENMPVNADESDLYLVGNVMTRYAAEARNTAKKNKRQGG